MKDKISSYSVVLGKVIKYSMAVLISLSVIVTMIGSSEESRRKMINMMISLQFIVFQSIMRFNIPGNLSSFIEQIMSMVGLDVLDLLVDWEEQPGASLMKFDFERHEQKEDDISNMMQDLGFSSHNSILVLNTVAVVLLILWAKSLFVLLLKPCRSLHSKLQQTHDKWKKGLILNAFIDLYISTYFEFMISSIFTLEFGTYAYYGEVISLVITIFSILFGLLIIPALSVWVIFQTEERLEDESVKDTIGVLYETVGGN